MTTAKSQVPAYTITEVEVVDVDGYKRYLELAKPAMAQHGGRFLVRGAKPIVAEGDWPPQQSVVVIEFQSMDQLKAWYDSPQYRAAHDVARKALRRLLFVEGVSTT